MCAFGANTTKGLVRNYNEDKISVSIQANPPPNFKGEWPEVHYFGIYDGHGGSQ